MFGFIYPNEIEVNWGLFIVLYPYITGLVAGAFIVSSLYHVFGVKELKPVSRLALISALALLVVAPLALISHLGQPLRALNMMWTPSPTSAMAGFGYIYGFYLILVCVEIWFMFRKDIVEFSMREGMIGKFYGILTLGAKDLSESSLHIDHKIVGILAIVGIPSAAFLHGYVGFIFGAIKSNPWWSTPLMPVIFLLSAIVSGVALLIVVYSASCWLRKKKIDVPCLMAMNKYLWVFLMFAFILEVLEVIHIGYEGKEEWPMIKGLITQVIPFTYFGVQLSFGMVLPYFMLMFGRSQRYSETTRKVLTIMSGAMILVGVLAMRFNVVIGGQLISKSLAGYAQFHVPLFKEGIVPFMGFLILPFVLLAILVRILPPWLDTEPAARPSRLKGFEPGVTYPAEEAFDDGFASPAEQ